MIISFHRWVLVFLFVCTSHCAWANDFSKMAFLSIDDIDVTAVLVAPPVKDSAEWLSDFEEIFRLQKVRSIEDCQRAAKSAASISLETMFGGEGLLTAQELKHWREFFEEKIFIDTGYFMVIAKGLWKRPRPYVSDNKVIPCIKLESSLAYPSGHAAISWTYARVLSHIYYERTLAFTKRALEIGHERILGGVHHPTDIAAGQKLGEAVFQKLLINKKFQAELSRLK